MTTAPATAAEPVCEHCGTDEGSLLPTPEGDHCQDCYAQVMGEGEADDPSCDATGIYEK